MMGAGEGMSMRSNSVSALSALAVAVIALLTHCLLGQARSSVYMRTPGTFTPNNTAVSSFGSYSYGMGSLNRYSASTSDILRSTMSSAGSTALTRRTFDASAVSGFPDMVAPPSGTYTKGRAGMGMMTAGQSGPGSLSTMLRSLNKGMTVDPSGVYISAITTNPSSRPVGDEPVTTLVPSEPSMYKLFMERGESAMRAGEFHRAFGEFQLANDIGGRDWMSLVSMTHARFASSAYSYYSAAFYARLALKCLPELPLVSLRPKEFFGNKAKYSDNMVDLENRVDLYPYDPDASFLLAYFRWFESNPQEARGALSRSLSAARAARSEEKIEAAEVFWRGMVASGKVSGVLEAPTLPPMIPPATQATQSRPAGDEQIESGAAVGLPEAADPSGGAKPAD